MVKNVVIIAGSCIPVPSATGSIALRYAKYLSSNNNCKVNVVCAQEQSNKYHGTVIDGITYFAIPNFRINRFQIHHERIKTSKGIKLLYHRFFHFLYRLIGKVIATFFAQNNTYWFKNKAYRALVEINKIKKVDCIISFNSPIESHFAGLNFKNRYGCIFIPFMTDLIPNNCNATNIFVTIKKLERMERKIIENCDRCFVTEEIFCDMENRLNESLLQSKIYPVKYSLNNEILNLNNKKANNNTFSETTTFFYYGSFYKDIRNPSYLLDFFGKINNASLIIYAAGNCDSIIKKAPSFGKTIFLFQPISFQDVIKKAAEADVLVNVDNTGTISKPSKMFELISYGKPIISFGNNKSHFDYNGQVCFISNDTDMKENIKKMEVFLSNFEEKYNKTELLKYYPDRAENDSLDYLASIIFS